jgi:CRP-like cAMP-binding protein
MYDFFLNSLKKYIHFTEEEEQTLTSKIQIRKVRKKQWLVTPGEHCKTNYFVNKGCFRAYYLADNGDQHTSKFAPEGWWITDINSLFTGAQTSLYVEALEDGEVIPIHTEFMDELYECIPQLNKYFRLVYQKALLYSNERVMCTISQTAGNHYRRFLELYPNLEQRVPQYMIASYLGITPEILSKEKARLLKKT